MGKFLAVIKIKGLTKDNWRQKIIDFDASWNTNTYLPLREDCLGQPSLCVQSRDWASYAFKFFFKCEDYIYVSYDPTYKPYTEALKKYLGEPTFKY